jgi:serine phosphatase RsbU (regulator of sigma subunit)
MTNKERQVGATAMRSADQPQAGVAWLPGGSRFVYLAWLFWLLWLPALAYPLVALAQSHPTPVRLVGTLATTALFLASYLWTTWCEARILADPESPAPSMHPAERWLPVVVMVVLSVTMVLVNGTAWVALFYYTGAATAGRLPLRQVAGVLAALVLLAGLAEWHLHTALSDGVTGGFFIALSGGAAMSAVWLISTNRQLAATRAEVARLAYERVEQELNTARRIQLSLLPSEVPALDGWQIAAYYQPAREVGGDFYDFLPFSDGRLGLVVGDVTDKGVPAALVMATTRSMLRAAALESATPGTVLARVNELLCADLPPNMFVTCFYAILDPRSGRLCYANAGQDLPYLRRSDGGVAELRATGMPLGLMADISYEEQEAELWLGDSVLFYSDGLVEAHNPARSMFGFARLAHLLGQTPADGATIDALRRELAAFTGAGWEQEDDVTLVTLRRTTAGATPSPGDPALAASASA